MRNLRPTLIVIVATLAGVALLGAPAVGRSSDERPVMIEAEEPICTSTEGAVGEHSQVCVLGVQETRSSEALATSGPDEMLLAVALALIGTGVIMRRAAARRG